MASKKKTQASHARKRVYERYGLIISSHAYKEICSLIHKGKGLVLAKQSNTKTIQYIKYKDEDFYLAYNSSTKQIATFLTKEMAERTAESYNF